MVKICGMPVRLDTNVISPYPPPCSVAVGGMVCVGVGVREGVGVRLGNTVRVGLGVAVAAGLDAAGRVLSPVAVAVGAFIAGAVAKYEEMVGYIARPRIKEETGSL